MLIYTVTNYFSYTIAFSIIRVSRYPTFLCTTNNCFCFGYIQFIHIGNLHNLVKCDVITGQ